MVHPASQESFFVTDPAEQTRLSKGGWKINGAGKLRWVAQPDTVGMQRLVKGSSKGSDRIFAITREQAAAALKEGYHSEGVMGQAAATQLTPDMLPVYRFTKNSGNLWLMDKADQSWAEKNGWKLEGVAFWIWPKE